MIRSILTAIIRAMGNAEQPKPESLGFKIVELMGHRRLAGEVFDVRISGERAFKVVCAEPSATEVHFTMRSVFAMTACTREEAEIEQRQCAPVPLEDTRRRMRMRAEDLAGKPFDRWQAADTDPPSSGPVSTEPCASSLLEDDMEKSSPGFKVDEATRLKLRLEARGFARQARHSVLGLVNEVGDKPEREEPTNW